MSSATRTLLKVLKGVGRERRTSEGAIRTEELRDEQALGKVLIIGWCLYKND